MESSHILIQSTDIHFYLFFSYWGLPTLICIYILIFNLMILDPTLTESIIESTHWHLFILMPNRLTLKSSHIDIRSIHIDIVLYWYWIYLYWHLLILLLSLSILKYIDTNISFILSSTCINMQSTLLTHYIYLYPVCSNCNLSTLNCELIINTRMKNVCVTCVWVIAYMYGISKHLQNQIYLAYERV